MKTVMAIRHVAFESLDGFEPVFLRQGYEVRYLDICDGDFSEADVADADVLVVLGGPIGANDEALYPFLKQELRSIERRIDAGKPMMGICLGAQLIARAAGARVYSSGAKEIGFGPIKLTEAGEDSALEPFGHDATTLHWHGDTFELPDGALHLASSVQCENQAFSLGDQVICFQFHPEATGSNIDHWLVGHCAELGVAGIDPRSIRDQAVRDQSVLSAKAECVAERWLDRLPLQ